MDRLESIMFTAGLSLSLLYFRVNIQNIVMALIAGFTVTDMYHKIVCLFRGRKK